MSRTTTSRTRLPMQSDARRDGSESGLAARYEGVRSETERLAAPLSAEDQTVQSMPEASPTKWHRAHVTWFFETFVLSRFLPGYQPHDRHYPVLFNSYYESVGERHPRPERGLITRPGVAEVSEYRRVVDDAMATLLGDPALTDHGDLLALVELGLHHEQQHQELMLMDIKHLLWRNPTRPAYAAASPRASSNGTDGGAPLTWSGHPGGLVEVGHRAGRNAAPGNGNGSAHDGGFAYDNEGPRHRVWLEPFELADRLVTVGEWCEFIDDGGYRRPELWLSDGWAAVQANGWKAPLYWTDIEGDQSLPRIFTLEGERTAHPAEPVCHLSHYEADAFARWAGARLPTEFEWEAAVDHVGARVGHDGTGLHPSAAVSGTRLAHPTSSNQPTSSKQIASLSQVGRDVWEWTSSAYLPYPGFTPTPGAVGEYNGKFMSSQMVLRGGACITPSGHTRPTYRNFFPPQARWVMSGVRLAR